MRINIISSSSSMMIILVSIVLMINIIDVSSMENKNDNNRQNKAPEFPSGGFNIITQPRNTMVQNHYQGSMENGYPTDNYQDPHRFMLLHSQEADLDIRRGNGQVKSRVLPPPDPPVPPKFDPKDYFMNDQRDYTKVPGEKDPRPATIVQAKNS